VKNRWSEPLSSNQEKKLKGEERDRYLEWSDSYYARRSAEYEEQYHLSNERLRDRIDELEERLSALEATK
jgi:lipid II:glycine glycyltransferase (peptidoglycan interpeptide bridge formation enzyme)